MPTTLGQSPPVLEEEGRYSFGTTPAINTLLEVLLKEMGTTKDAEEVILINIATLVRNRQTKEKSMKKIAEEVMTDITGIRKELTDLLGGGNLRKYLIFFTMPYDRQVPQTHLRPDSQQRAQVKSITTMLRTLLPNSYTSYGKLDVAVVISDSVRPSFLVIREAVNKFPIVHPKMHLISHYPIDYHLFRWYKGSIIKSFSGEVVEGDMNAIGEYVFRRPIPFHRTTHALLGDREMIVGTATVKQRKEIEELSASESWEMRTGNYIEESLRAHKYEIPPILK